MSEVIPFFNNSANFQEEITLDGTPYIFDFVWNERAKQWTLNLMTPDEVVLIGGITLVLGYSLLEIYQYRTDIPPGELFCIDSTEKEEKITRINMGSIVELVYIPEGEV